MAPILLFSVLAPLGSALYLGHFEQLIIEGKRKREQVKDDD